jgi:hypothetical protein
MSVSYEEAREIVRRDTEPQWGFGTYCLDDREILENDEIYVFNVGAREFIVGGDISFSLVGGLPVVYKADGRLGTLPSVMVAMDPSLRTRPNPHPTFTS